MKKLLRLLAILALVWTSTLIQVVAEPRKSDNSVELLREIYALAGPEIGCQLLEPDKVLALSGYFAVLQSSTFWGEPDLLREKVDILNERLRPAGIALVLEVGDRVKNNQLRIINLDALSEITAAAGAEFLVIYHKDSGWAGFDKWENYQHTLLKAYQGKVDVLDTTNYFSLFTGVLLRIPRVALGKDAAGPYTWAACSYSGKLECLSSQYKLPVSVREHASVRAEQEARAAVLRGVYEHPKVISILQADEFKSARRRILSSRDESPDMGWWSDERGELGIWNEQQWDKMKELRAARFKTEFFGGTASRIRPFYREAHDYLFSALPRGPVDARRSRS